MRITDIGVDTFVRGMFGSGSVPVKWRYKPSEELEHGIRDTQTDVYSFASTLYSVNILIASAKTNGSHPLVDLYGLGHLPIREKIRFEYEGDC